MVNPYKIKIWLVNPKEYVKGAVAQFFAEEDSVGLSEVGQFNTNEWLLVDIISSSVDIDPSLIPVLGATDEEILEAYIENGARNANKA